MRFLSLIPKESEEQITYFDWVAKTVKPEYADLIWHNPNGGYRSKRTGARLKREGTKKGVPDITIAIPKGAYHGAYLEAKRIKKNKITTEQIEKIEALRKQGYYCKICLGADELIEATKNYLNLKQNAYIDI